MKLELFRQHVLALMMVDVRFLTTASVILHPRYFETPQEQHLARVILEHFREFKQIPQRLSVLHRLHDYFKMTKSRDLEESDMVEYLDEILEWREAAAEQAEFIHAKLVEFCREQGLTEALIASVEDIQKRNIGPAIRQRIEKALSIGTDLTGSGIFWLADAGDAEKGLSSIDDIRDTVSTGLPYIDKPTRGGLAKGELGIVVAPPHTGKTTVLANIGVGALKHRANVVHLSLEMKDRLIRAMYDRCFMQRTDTQLSSLSSDEHQAVAAWLNRVNKKLQSDVAIKHFAPHRLSIEGMRAYLLMLESVHGFKADMVIVDYLDLLQMPTHIKDEVKQLTWVGEELRAMADEMNFACWTATQTNRGGVNKETVLADDVSGDFMKIAYADMVCSLNQTKKEADEGSMRVFWLKTRAGKKYQTYTVYTDFDKAKIEPA